MKKTVLLLFLCFVALNANAVEEITLKVGDTDFFYVSAVNNAEAGPIPFVTGNSIAVTDISVDYYGKMRIEIKAVSSGYSAICIMDYYQRQSRTGYIFHVVDVTDIDIANMIDITSGDSYSYNPIITDAEATTTLTWTSSNTAVATVNTSGVVTAVAPGKANITCTASNGVSAQSLVTVSPKLAESLTLDSHSQEMTTGGSMQLLPTILPANTSSTSVKWMTTNENVAQVDDQGTVTAIGPGYCSIFCIAGDGSRKYDKCLVHVLGTAASRADVNGDGHVSVTDAYSVIDVILNNP